MVKHMNIFVCLFCFTLTPPNSIGRLFCILMDSFARYSDSRLFNVCLDSYKQFTNVVQHFLQRYYAFDGFQ